MPITYHFKPELNLVVIAHTGSIPDSEFLDSYRALYADDRFDLSMDQLVDLRCTDSSPRSPSTLRQFANFVLHQHIDCTVRSKVAVVAPKDISFGLARMYEIFTDTAPWDFVVFRAADAALAWLGAPENLLDNLDQDD